MDVLGFSVDKFMDNDTGRYQHAVKRYLDTFQLSSVCLTQKGKRRLLSVTTTILRISVSRMYIFFIEQALFNV